MQIHTELWQLIIDNIRPNDALNLILCSRDALIAFDARFQKKYKKKFIVKARKDVTKNNGFVKKEFHMIDSYEKCKHGLFVSYYRNKNIKQKKHYIHNKLHGAYVSYYESGEVRKEKNYVKGRASEKYIEYYKNGKVKEIGIYGNGSIIKITNFLENGDLHKIMDMQCGFRHGQTLKYKNDMLIAEILHNKNNRIYAKKFHKNGNLKKIQYGGKFCKGGDKIEYFADGTISSKRTYSKGQLQGAYIVNFPDGKLCSLENYENDKKNGMCRYFYPDGSLEGEFLYRNGEIEIGTKYYYGNIVHEKFEKKIKETYDINGNLLYKYFYNKFGKIKRLESKEVCIK